MAIGQDYRWDGPLGYRLYLVAVLTLGLKGLQYRLVYRLVPALCLTLYFRLWSRLWSGLWSGSSLFGLHPIPHSTSLERLVATYTGLGSWFWCDTLAATARPSISLFISY